jgi:dTMP kinase
MRGRFITLEGSEGTGKSTQAALLVERLRRTGHRVTAVREPGGTPLGEEIRHTLKHSAAGSLMTPEAELFLLNASRAQLVRQVIRPALAAGEIVVCDRFYDSTTAYQGYGRQLPLARVAEIIDLAVGDTRPALTLLLVIPWELSEERRKRRVPGGEEPSDRFEQADRDFFARVEAGFAEIAKREPGRVRVIDAASSIEVVSGAIWQEVERLLAGRPAG